jgi:hypothetical protein
MKHLHKFFNKSSVPWVQLVWDHYYSRNRLPVLGRTIRGSFWWRDILKLLDSYKSFARVNIQNGTTCLLWFALWEDRVYNQAYPELFSFAKAQHISLSVALSTMPRQTLFHLPLSNEAFGQFQELSNTLDNIQPTHSNDIWSYTWGSSFYSSKQAYM